jgi:hypothetical protein
MTTKSQIIAAFDKVAELHDITNPDRLLCTPKLRQEFLSELQITDDESEAEVLHQLLNLRKRKLLKQPASLVMLRKTGS